jgi:hypothetical protein
MNVLRGAKRLFRKSPPSNIVLEYNSFTSGKSQIEMARDLVSFLFHDLDGDWIMSDTR